MESGRRGGRRRSRRRDHRARPRERRTARGFPGRPLVREGGVEPPRPFGHTDLNRARLPIPPLAPEASLGYPTARPAAQTGAGRWLRWPGPWQGRPRRTAAERRPVAHAPARDGGQTRRPGPTVTTERRCAMGGLRRFEDRLEQMISGVFARAFRSAVAAGRDLGRARTARSTTPHRSSAATGGWCPTSSTSSCAAGPRAARAVLGPALDHELVEMLRDHAHEQSYVFTGPVTIDLERERGPHHRPLPGAQRRRSAQVTLEPRPTRSDTAVRRAHRDPRGQRQAAPADPARHRDRPRQRGRPADQRPRRLPAARRAARGRRTAPAAGSASRPRLDQRHERQRAQGRSRPTLADGAQIRIGNTTMTVRLPCHEARRTGLRRWSRRCLS